MGATNCHIAWGDTVRPYNKHEFAEPASRAPLFFQDSIFLQVDTPRTLEQTREDLLPILDTSNFASCHKLYSTKFKSIPGKYKDESEAKFKYVKSISLASKMYAVQSEPIVQADGSIPKAQTIYRCKGVSKAAVKKNFTIETYEKVLLESAQEEVSFRKIQMKDQRLFTQHQTKTALTSCDSKRWLSCPIHTESFHAYFIDQFKGQCRQCLEEAELDAKIAAAKLDYFKHVNQLEAAAALEPPPLARHPPQKRTIDTKEDEQRGVSAEMVSKSFKLD